MDSLLIIGSAGSVGHDMMYQISSMTDKIQVVGADYNEAKGRYEAGLNPVGEYLRAAVLGHRDALGPGGHGLPTNPGDPQPFSNDSSTSSPSALLPTSR